MGVVFVAATVETGVGSFVGGSRKTRANAVCLLLLELLVGRQCLRVPMLLLLELLSRRRCFRIPVIEV